MGDGVYIRANANTRNLHHRQPAQQAAPASVASTMSRAPLSSSSTAAPAAPAAAVPRPKGEGDYYNYAEQEYIRAEQKKAEDARKAPKPAEVAPQGMDQSMAKLKGMTGDFFSQF